MPNWRYEQIFQGDASVRIDAMDLHVKSNRIFWTNWHTGRISSYELPEQSSSLSSSNSHGNRRQNEGVCKGVSARIQISELKMPRGIAVDWVAGNLYWTDSGRDVIEVAQMSKMFQANESHLLHPFSIDIFEDYIYGVTYMNNFVFRVNKFGKGPMENLTTGINHATDIVLYHRYKQPEIPNPCDKKKCEWLCLLSPSGPVCTCPNNYIADNGTCVERPIPTLSPFSPPSEPCSLQCLNGGSCFFNAHQVQKCRCQPSYVGARCEVNQCRDYCKNGGTCTSSRTGTPTCRCPKGFTGPNCNLHTCQDYCLNGGNCLVSMGNQPTCSCKPDYQGDQCQYSKCEDFCQNGGTCLQTSNGTKLCQCPIQYTGHHCELDKCQFCGEGKLSCYRWTVKKMNSFLMCLCSCTNGHTQSSCYTCLDYCAQGQCSFDTRTLLPTCSAKGFQHHRMTNGAMNVEIGNPAYKIYEGDPDDDAGELLDSDFTLDPDKPTNFTNPVYATLYMGAHNSRNSLASTDEKKELLSQGDDDMNDPLA
ncbi:hypothetical protein XENOCAPTIV_002905 [Xenoophorus captivus]|uniref:EGF-like domain-containing protein n=1 Tax=Xenoophorus captivus TaxID=1517983 RepID=A0ABV0RF56_9TELE